MCGIGEWRLVEKYVRVVQDMYEGSVTVVRRVVRVTDGYKVKVGLHEGSALSLLLFAVVMVHLTNKIRQESLWTTISSDDVICSGSREQDEERLER